MAPSVSVVLPFRSAEGTIAEAVDSVLSQSLDSWELIAIDDSEDGPPDILLQYARRDARLSVVRSPGRGLVAALNEGLARARAPFIARMDADDIMLPLRLELQLRAMEGDPSLAVMGCQVELFPEEEILAGYREYVRWQNGCVTAAQIAAQIYVESPFAHPSVMFRADVIGAMGGYLEGDFPEDYELWLRLHAGGVRMAKVPEVLLRWRESSGRASRVDPRYSREAFDRLRARYLARDARIAGRDLVFWGAGRKTRLRARHAIAAGLRPVAWIDIDPKKTGRAIAGIPVHPPEWLQRTGSSFVLVWVTNHGAREEIGAFLAERGFVEGRDYMAVG